ncbi:Putative acyl-CoA dehydrogenase AidB [bacterium HR29]|jgi:acyl-CoA dehydrogenase|nr:Putative acyl-CoA dehydrogenase AidB [bacterium HR29]
MQWESIASPLAAVREALGTLPDVEALADYERFLATEGREISAAVDRAGTPWLRQFDRDGRRIDEVLYPPEYRRLLARGYEAGAVWRAFAEGSLFGPYAVLYLTAFADPGLSCPYTVSLSTAVPLEKYAEPAVRDRFLPPMLAREGVPWQGATWMTEVRGGSDLGAGVETTAVPAQDGWRLTGDKYFASNAGAELAVVAARIQGAPRTVRGLALFLVPRFRADGAPNYTVRRLKDKIATRSVPTGEVELRDAEAYLLGTPEHGIYLILEVLNLSRVANSVGSAALMQRCLAEATAYAHRRVAFGKPIAEHPLLREQFRERLSAFEAVSALAWESVRALDAVWRERPPYSQAYHEFRLLAHLAKYWTAEQAVQTAKWAMEVHGGLGTLAEFGVERWLREAMILVIWEGTPHRQILDGLEVIERRQAHRALLDRLRPYAPEAIARAEEQLAWLLDLPPDQREENAEAPFRALAEAVAFALAARRRAPATP